MDYKDLIDTIRTVISSREGDCYNCEECVEAIAAIETLLAERDAAVEDLRGNCIACAHFSSCHSISPCSLCKYEDTSFFSLVDYIMHSDDNWEWRGPQKGAKNDKVTENGSQNCKKI